MTPSRPDRAAGVQVQRLLAGARRLPAVVPPPLDPARAAELSLAYARAHYRLAGPQAMPSLTLAGLDEQNGARPDAIWAWLCEHQARTAVVITACQPFSLGVSPAEDQARHALWTLAVESSGMRGLASAALAPHGDWPEEPGFVLLDLPFVHVPALLQACSQWAGVWLDGRGAQLAWHPSWPVPASPIGVKNSTS